MCILKRARVSVIFCGRWEFWAQIISQHYPPVCGPACNFLQCIDVTFTLEDNSGLKGTFKPFIAKLWMYTLNGERALYLHIYWPADYITLTLYMFISTKLAFYSVASLIQWYHAMHSFLHKHASVLWMNSDYYIFHLQRSALFASRC